MITELYIIGQPSFVGGANTELLHQIICWKKMGIDLYILPTRNLNDKEKQIVSDHVKDILPEKQWHLLKNKICISFCNDTFLQNLRLIKAYCKKVIWVNCMTWTFRKERKAQEEGIIDFHLYQSKHGHDKIKTVLNLLGKPFRSMIFKPYFHMEYFPFINDRQNEFFQFGRISRSDSMKYIPNLFEVYHSITSQRDKKAIVLGWEESLQTKMTTKPQKWITLLPPNSMSSNDFYKFSECVVMPTLTFENLPRVAFEAMSSGSVLIVDNRGGWKNLVDHGKTGFLCDSQKDFIKYSSVLADDDELRSSMALLARNKLEREWGYVASSLSWMEVFQWVTKTKI